jgi:hypothetical protein
MLTRLGFEVAIEDKGAFAGLSPNQIDSLILLQKE